MALTPQQKVEAIRLAWTEGNLRYKLKPIQRTIYDSLKSCTELIYVINCSRRLGKSTTMACLALETALRTPNSHVHYGAPTQKDLKKFILPIFRQLLADCPDDLRPEWKQFDGCWVFPNGSFIQLCGCNNKQYDNLRGSKSDLFILDEAGQIDELDDIVKSIALPQLLSSTHPGKRIILPSTPPTTPDHDFKTYAEIAMGRAAYATYDIYRSWYSPEEIARFIEEMGGIKSTTVRRELFCEFVTDETLHIIPEWRNHPEFVCEVPKDDLFQFYFPLEGLDVGYRDFTFWILGYYDFSNAQVVIEYELALRENEFTTDNLAQGIHDAEATYKKVTKARFRRIADNSNLNILADLARLHRLPFTPVSKKNGKEWMVNQARQLIKAGKLKVHPRCKMLIASLEFGIWQKGRDEFARSRELGHYDAIDALVYLISNLVPAVQNINPIPPLYQLDLHKTMFPNGMPPQGVPNSQDAELRKIFKPII